MKFLISIALVAVLFALETFAATGTASGAKSAVRRSGIVRELRDLGCKSESITFTAKNLIEKPTAEQRTYFVNCPELCRARGCTNFVYLAEARDSHYRSIGLVDGTCEPQSTVTKGYFDLKCHSESAEQSIDKIWKFNGEDYR